MRLETTSEEQRRAQRLDEAPSACVAAASGIEATISSPISPFTHQCIKVAGESGFFALRILALGSS